MINFNLDRHCGPSAGRVRGSVLALTDLLGKVLRARQTRLALQDDLKTEGEGENK